MAMTGTACAAMVIFKTLAGAHLAGTHVIAVRVLYSFYRQTDTHTHTEYSLVHCMSSGHLAALWIKNHLKEKLIGDLRDQVIEKLTEYLQEENVLQCKHFWQVRGRSRSGSWPRECWDYEKYIFRGHERIRLVHIGIHGSNKERWFSRQVQDNFLNTGENSCEGKYESHVVNQVNLELIFETTQVVFLPFECRKIGRSYCETQRGRSCTDVGGLCMLTALTLWHHSSLSDAGK